MTSLSTLLPLSVGNTADREVTVQPSDIPSLFDEAEKQALTGVVGEVVSELLPSTDDLGEYEDAYYEWMGELLRIEEDNHLLNARTGELTAIFREAGFRTCVLKGQGLSQRYPHPERRICGDIDLWVDAPRKVVLDFIRSKGWKLGDIVIHHAEVTIFDDTPTEIHFWPSYTYSPIRYRKYLRFFRESADRQFDNFDTSLGFSYPIDSFNAVYLLLHIFRHVFNEGIGLRQLMDYYYVLVKLHESDRSEAIKIIRWMGLEKFTASVMYILKEVFELESEKMLCLPDERSGKRLLDEIMAGGNFGKYDDRVNAYSGQYSIKAFSARIGRLLGFAKDYPSEVFWAPLWKVWHSCWRKWNGYI